MHGPPDGGIDMPQWTVIERADKKRMRCCES